MKSPFKYGKVVSGKQFINRKEEIKRIQNNIAAGNNTIIISPRRWGKSSLMKQLEFLNADKKVKFAFIDFTNIRTVDDFLEKYSREIIRSSISKKEEIVNWNGAYKTKDEIINLPETIARKKGIKIVVCIDEFQNFARLRENISFEQELRSCWQNHDNTSYCLYGSRKHMMLDRFKHKTGAFFRFGDLFMMEKIPAKHWIKFIMSSFENTGKSISRDLVKRIIGICNNHPDYLQQLCHHVWNRTESEATARMVDEALILVLRSNSLYYQSICDALSNTQLNLLYAILAGEIRLTATRTMQQFKLGTPRNVLKNKQTLIEKEIVEMHGQSIAFIDPIFEYWLRLTFD